MVKNNDEKRSFIRHLAYQIVAQLPEDSADALLVLGYATRLVEHPIEQPDTTAALKIVKMER